MRQHRLQPRHVSHGHVQRYGFASPYSPVYFLQASLIFLIIPCESSGSLNESFSTCWPDHTHTGPTNEFKCEPCTPASCSTGEERRGECSGTTNTFACVPCKEGFFNSDTAGVSRML